MDRKQQLEQLGSNLLQDWQARMGQVAELPLAPELLLQDALPAYRTWLMALWQMQQSWQGALAGTERLLDPMLPWHWCGVAQAPQEAAAAPVNLARKSPSYVTPRPPMPPARRQRPELAGAWELPGSGREVGVPPLSPEAEPRQQTAPSVPGDAPGSGPETALPANRPAAETQQTPAPKAPANTPAEEPAEIVFRRLDDFAAFVQQAPTPEKAAPSPLAEIATQPVDQPFAETAPPHTHVHPDFLPISLHSPEEKHAQAPPQVNSRSTANLPTDIPQALPENPANNGHQRSKRQMPEHAQAISHQREITPQANPGRQVLPTPPNLAVHPQRQAPLPKLPTAHSPEKSNPRVAHKHAPEMPLSDWDQVQQKWEEMTQAAPSRNLHSRRSPQILPRHTRTARTLSPEKHSATPPSQPIREVPEHPQPLANPFQNSTAAPTSRKPDPASALPPLQEEDLLDRLTEQLQRDFKRYYGG